MLITVSRYSFPYEVYIAKTRLDSEGIPSFIADEHTINMQWLYSNALGGVKLQVPEAYVEAALAVLAENREKDLAEEHSIEAAVCPHCESNNTEFNWSSLGVSGVPWFRLPAVSCRRRHQM